MGAFFAGLIWNSQRRHMEKEAAKQQRAKEQVQAAATAAATAAAQGDDGELEFTPKKTQ
jgi:hypothetical protein